MGVWQNPMRPPARSIWACGKIPCGHLPAPAPCQDVPDMRDKHTLMWKLWDQAVECPLPNKVRVELDGRLWLALD